MEKTYVLINAVSDNDKVLLVMKDRPQWQKGLFNLVGGRVEEGESFRKAAVRELKEESGYEVLEEDLTLAGVIYGREERIFCFNAKVDASEEVKPRPEETEKVAWYPWRLIKEDRRLMPSLRLVLPLMMSGVYNWIIEVTKSLVGKELGSVSVSLSGNLNLYYYEDQEVTRILKGQ